MRLRLETPLRLRLETLWLGTLRRRLRLGTLRRLARCKLGRLG
ncbi:hypothetical protein [Streptosporangium sp. NPDC000396]